MARGLIVSLMPLILFGCGRSLLLDSTELEAAIPPALVPDAPDSVSDVDCPEVLVAGPGTTMCFATIAGISIDVSVAISADNRAIISTDAVVIEVAEMEATAAARLTADLGVATTLTCPGPPVIVSAPGVTLACDAIDPSGAAHQVVFTVRSETGNWELSIES